MKQRDILALMDGMAPGIAASFAKAIAPVLARLEAAEKRVADLDKAPADIDLDAIIAAVVDQAVAGITVDFEEVGRVVDERLAKAVDALPKAPTAEDVAALVPTPAAGKDADPKVTRTLVDDQVGEAVAALEAMLKGSVDAMIGELKTAAEGVKADYQQAIADLPKVPTAEEVRALIPTPEAGKDADPEVVKSIVAEAVAALPPAQPGKDATPEQVAEAVEKVLATWPKPKDGESVTIEQLRPMVDETVAKRVAEIPTPKDGVNLAGALKDHEGCLVLTLSDGTVVKLGRVDGEPGKDGLGFDNMEVTHDGERTFTFRLIQGERVKEFPFSLPVVLDRGVFKDGTDYVAGDGTTWGGSFWIAQTTTKDKPGTSDAWRLSVKKGRDGQDLRPAEPKPPKPVKL